MLTLKILLGVSVIAAFFLALKKFDEHCADKFGHKFFTKSAFYLTATALAFGVAGGIWRLAAAKAQDDQLNGIVLMIVGGLIAIWMIFRNVKQTNIVYGIGGSLTQLLIFSVLAYLSLPLLIISLLLQFMATSGRRVYVIRR